MRVIINSILTPTLNLFCFKNILSQMNTRHKGNSKPLLIDPYLTIKKYKALSVFFCHFSAFLSHFIITLPLRILPRCTWVQNEVTVVCQCVCMCYLGLFF